LKTIVIWLSTPRLGCFDFNSKNHARLVEAFPNDRLVVCKRESEFLSAIGKADAALVWRFEQDWFTLAPKLRVLSTPAAGHENCDVVPPETVALLYGSFHGVLMAETVVGMVLAASRGILMTAWIQGTNPWPREELDRIVRPLRGSHVAILGFGAIGRVIGRRLKPFGVRVTGVKRSRAEVPDYFDGEDRIALVDEVDAILPDTDHLVICLPRNRDTDRILNASRLALLPKRGWVYNVGRGNAIDENALAESLTAGRIAGACLDVYAQEPLPDESPLRMAPNLLLMPHASAFSPTYLDHYLDELIPFLKQHGD